MLWCDLCDPVNLDWDSGGLGPMVRAGFRSMGSPLNGYSVVGEGG